MITDRFNVQHMLVDDIALTLYPGVGSRTAIHLIACFGSAERLFAATADEIVERAELRPDLAQRISRREYHERAAKEVDSIRRNGIRAIDSLSPDYPQRLRECSDYPHVLYVSGDIDLNRGRWLTVVGTRDCTAYGAGVCERIIREVAGLCPDIVVVSGLAFGIDIAAHRAAMQAGLATVGVVAHPLDRIYPREHTRDARRMVHEGGAVVTEFCSGYKTERSSFICRNRIIAGLSDGTLVVESHRRGGSLVTAGMADGYHRIVMAVPGRVSDSSSDGTNGLIKSLKAQMVCCGQDVVEALNWQPADPVEPVRKPARQSPIDILAGSPEEAVLQLIGTDVPVSSEELSLRSGIAPQELSPLLLELEFSGLIRSLRGSFYVRC